MYAVVNHMKLSRPFDADVIARMNSELMASIATMPGAVNALCVQVADDGIVVVVICESAEALERVHQEVGSPWVGENLKPYLASTDRGVGPVIARRLRRAHIPTATDHCPAAAEEPGSRVQSRVNNAVVDSRSNDDPITLWITVAAALLPVAGPGRPTDYRGDDRRWRRWRPPAGVRSPPRSGTPRARRRSRLPLAVAGHSLGAGGWARIVFVTDATVRTSG